MSDTKDKTVENSADDRGRRRTLIGLVTRRPKPVALRFLARFAMSVTVKFFTGQRFVLPMMRRI